jgi:outer membrane protein assembly factor BamA
VADLASIAGRPRPPGALPGRLRGAPALRRLGLALLFVLVIWPPRSAGAEYSFIPLPSIDTDPNAGATYGVLPVLLLRDQADVVKTIIAPSVTYNEFRGWTGTFRYYAFPTAAERFDFEAGYSETIERRLNLHYRNQALFGERFHTDLQVLFDRDSTVRFFGLGPFSKRVDETNMTLQVAGFFGTFGVNITPTTRLSLTETVEQFDVLRGSIPGLPFTRTVFPTLPGVDGAFIHAQKVALAYDSRDSQTTPTQGISLTLYAEASAELLGSSSDYIKWGGEGVYLQPVWAGRLVLVARGLVEAISGGSNVPFEVRPTLGGATTLRGFSQNRFYGDARVLANVESRIRLFVWRLFGVTTEFQAAPFVDMGKVFSSTDQLIGSGFEVTPGIGFRGLAPPSIVGRVEIGVSREGPAVFVGLDYPF